jgi:hypothetical protein
LEVGRWTLKVGSSLFVICFPPPINQ